MIKTYAFWCEHAYSVYSAKPIVEKYKLKGYKIIVFTEDPLIPIAKSFLNLNESEIQAIEPHKSIIGAYLTKYFLLTFVANNFSEFYERRKKIKLKMMGTHASPSGVSLNINKKKINKLYVTIFKFLNKIGLLTKLNVNFDRIFAFTKINYPYILAPFNKKMFLIMESWDHPSKEPFLATPVVTFAWNIDLISEIRNYQFYSRIHKIKPLKFEYIKDLASYNSSELLSYINNKTLLDDLAIFEERKVAVYPMCTSSKYFGFEGEINFINELSKAVKLAGYYLYVRPYPLAPISDKDRIEISDHTIVGCSSKSADGTDVLNKELQVHKYLTLRKAKLLINIGTTFVFDASLVGLPVVQLSLSTDKFGDFSEYSKGIHIDNYLLKNKWAKVYRGNPEELAPLINEDMMFSISIKSWVNGHTV